MSRGVDKTSQQIPPRRNPFEQKIQGPKEQRREKKALERQAQKIEEAKKAAGPASLPLSQDPLSSGSEQGIKQLLDALGEHSKTIAKNSGKISAGVINLLQEANARRQYLDISRQDLKNFNPLLRENRAAIQQILEQIKESLPKGSDRQALKKLLLSPKKLDGEGFALLTNHEGYIQKQFPDLGILLFSEVEEINITEEEIAPGELAWGHEGPSQIGTFTIKDSLFRNFSILAAESENLSAIKSKFISTRIQDSSFSQALFKDCSFDDTLVFRSNLDGASFPGCSGKISFEATSLRAADFRGTNLQGIVFHRCDLEGADFSGADLTGARFTLSDLSKANFSGAKIDGIIIDESSLEESNFSDSSLQGALVVRANIEGAIFARANLKDADIHSSQGNAFSFANSDLEGAKLKLAAFSKASFAAAKMTNSRLELSKCINSNFDQASLERAHIVGASEEHYPVIEKTSLRQANLSGAKITAITLKKNDISDTRLSGAKIQASTFRDNNFTNLDISGAVFRESVLEKEDLRFISNWRAAKFVACDLQKSNLSNLNLAGVSFLLSDLRAANLSKSRIHDSDFKKADLEGADLSLTGYDSFIKRKRLRLGI